MIRLRDLSPAYRALLRRSMAGRAEAARRPRGMNGLERDYAARLRLLASCDPPQVIWWAWQPIRVRLSDGPGGAFYTPDFVLLTAAGDIEAHETKGFMREAARVRLMVAVDRLPWLRIVLVRRGPVGASWSLTEVAGGAQEKSIE